MIFFGSDGMTENLEEEKRKIKIKIKRSKYWIWIEYKVKIAEGIRCEDYGKRRDSIIKNIWNLSIYYISIKHYEPAFNNSHVVCKMNMLEKPVILHMLSIRKLKDGMLDGLLAFFLGWFIDMVWVGLILTCVYCLICCSWFM